MFKKIKLWWRLRKNKQFDDFPSEDQMYTKEQLLLAHKMGYNDGKRDGLTIAREQATNSLKEIVWQQNQENRK